MDISKIALAWKAVTGGIAGIVEYLLTLFNEQVLAHVTVETARKYCHDVIALGIFLKTVLENHKDDLPASKRVAISAIIDAVDELADALSDAKIEPAELDAIIDCVKDAIEAWKDAK